MGFSLGLYGDLVFDVGLLVHVCGVLLLLFKLYLDYATVHSCNKKLDQIMAIVTCWFECRSIGMKDIVI